MHGRDDLPRIILEGMHSSDSLSSVFANSVHSSSTVLPKRFIRNDCWYDFILALRVVQSAVEKSNTLRGFCLCRVGLSSASAETMS